MKVGVIISTYNWPEALDCVLEGLALQTCLPNEVIIADDGSGSDTKACIDKWKKKEIWPINHVWHPDEGFRSAAIKNKGIIASSSDYLLFLDGDCIPMKDWIQQHLRLAQKGYFVSGNRILLSSDFTKQCLDKTYRIRPYTMRDYFVWWLKGQSNRWIPAWRLPGQYWRFWGVKRWQGAKTCNLAAWRSDLIAIKGFEETLTGWGFEDSECAQRLINQGVLHKNGRYGAAVIHLYHPVAKRDAAKSNKAYLLETCHKKRIYAQKGIEQDADMQNT